MTLSAVAAPSDVASKKLARAAINHSGTTPSVAGFGMVNVACRFAASAGLTTS
ncbi:MAG: hypothetical protein JO023_12165 [Chloroflexi bacterium]|nr:hypothetical protein [Chloroflexota bacterium]